MPETSRTRAWSYFRAPSAALALVLLVTYALYAPALRFDFVWDDASLIVGDPRLRSFEHLGSLLSTPLWQATSELREAAGYYRPVVSLAYLLEYQAFGQNPFGYHVVSLALHLACTALLFWWLRARIAGRHQAGRHQDEKDDERAPRLQMTQTLAASAGALYFALHPSKAESVAWISGCSDAFMTLFVLASSLAASRGRAALACTFAALAVLSKENAVVLPGLLALDALLLHHAGVRRTQLRISACTGGVVAAWLALRFVVAPLPQRMLTGVLRDLPVRVVASLGEYVSAAVLPMAPTSLRGHVAFAADGSLSPSWPSLGIGVLSLVFAAWLAHRAWRAPHVRPYAADLAWFFLPLVPVLNILPLRLESLVAERFMHLASVGIAAVLARALLLFCLRQARGVRIGVAGCVALTLVFALVSVPRVFAFANDGALWRYEYRRKPNESYVLYRLANEALIAGAPEDAIAISREGYLAAHEARSRAYEVRFVLLMAQAASRMTPDSEPQALRDLRDFYDALAKNELATLVLPAWKLRVRFGRELAPVVSSDALLFALPRALAHARTGDLERAIALLRESARREPTRPETFRLLATLLERTGRSDEAREALREANALSSEATTFRLRSSSASTR